MLENICHKTYNFYVVYTNIMRICNFAIARAAKLKEAVFYFNNPPRHKKVKFV